MGKALTLLLTILLALASVGGYVYLTGKITDGERRIAEGEGQLEEGRATLQEGQAELEAGKRELAAGEEAAEVVEDVDPLGGLLGGAASGEIDRQLAEGNEEVADGEDRVAAGQERITAGELALRRGKERLQTARRIRVAFALGAAVFALLSIVLGFRWRRSLARTLGGEPE